MSGPEAIGVDLGGTKMLVGVVGDGCSVLHRSLVRSHDRAEQEVVDLLEHELRAATVASPAVQAIGLGVPCTIDRRQGICVSAVNLPLSDLPLRDIIAERLGLPTSIDNDANAAVLAEHRHGAARGASNVVMLTIGTGIGGGLILDGRLYRGSTGAGAELGHIVIDSDGPSCQGSCPSRGCVESLASGTALAREGAAAAESHPASALGRARAAGDAIDARRVVAEAQGGDAVAIDVLALIGVRIGVALAGIANALDPDVFVLGGGVMAAGDLILAPARDELRRRALPPQNEAPVSLARFGPEAGMIGAAILALEELEELESAGRAR